MHLTQKIDSNKFPEFTFEHNLLWSKGEVERELGFNLISKENQRGHFSLDGLAEGHFQGGSGSGGTGWKKRILLV